MAIVMVDRLACVSVGVTERMKVALKVADMVVWMVDYLVDEKVAMMVEQWVDL